LRRRRAGVAGDDCEWEHETEAQVCVSVSDASLDCSESYDRSYYRSCQVEVDYEVVTNFEGDGYLDVEIECTAEIRYKGRNSYSWSHESADDDETHTLYPLGSDSGDVGLDFSFSSYKEVVSVQLESAQCEVDSVYHY